MTGISELLTNITLKQYRKFSKSFMTEVTSIKANIQESTVPRAKAFGPTLSLLTENVPNADVR